MSSLGELMAGDWLPDQSVMGKVELTGDLAVVLPLATSLTTASSDR